MIRKDGSFAFPYISQLSTHLVGIEAREVEKNPNLFFENVFPDDVESFYKSIEESARSMNAWEYSFRYVMPDKSIKWFHGRSIPHLLPTGEPLWNGVIFDDTERKNAQMEIAEKDRLLKETLLRAKEELETKVTERTLELRIANEELKKAKEVSENATILKDKFVSIVSHDLRSPLAGIIGMLDIMDSKIALKIDDEKRSQIISRVRNTGKGLLNMVDKLLDIGRLQTGKIKLQKKYTDVRSLTSMYIDQISYVAQEKNITIKNELPSNMRLFIDSDLFGEVIQNLVSNAVKFCSAGDTVTIFKPDGKQSAISVKDTGTGIDKNLIDDLFKHEVKTTTFGTNGEKGTGLGLPYCKDIMMAHGGTISLETEIGKGTVFHIELPITKTIIIVADDQEVQRDIITEQLRKITDAEILEAATGKEILKILTEVTPSLIITDIQMPEMDGLEALKIIRLNPTFQNIPVIINSAHSSSNNGKGEEIDIRNKVFELGAADFILKPVVPEDFIPRVKRFIG